MPSDRVPDRTWTYGEHPDQTADVYLPAPGVPERSTIVIVHGGFWRPIYDRTHIRPLAAALADRGHEVFSLEYRRIPGEPDATVADVRLATSLLPANVQLVGHSAGGHLVLWLAGEPALTVTTVALAPVGDLALASRLGLGSGAVESFLGCSPADRPDLDPARRGAPPNAVTVIHGMRDDVVPISVGESFAAATGARLVPLPDCGHFEVIEPDTVAWPVLVAELDRLADGPTSNGY